MPKKFGEVVRVYPFFVSAVISDRLTAKTCDEIIHEPTMVVKLDATVNMYHHFCDFVNLYASLHFNRTAYSDVNIIVWDGVSRPDCRDRGCFAPTVERCQFRPPRRRPFLDFSSLNSSIHIEAISASCGKLSQANLCVTSANSKTKDESASRIS